MSSTLDPATGRAQISAKTLRTDRWWLPPLLTAAGLDRMGRSTRSSTRSCRSGTSSPEYNYLTPFYSPCVSLGCRPERRALRPLPARRVVAALRGRSSLPFLLLFRLTCYYYRKAYYRAFWLSPPACAVAEPHRRYTGETRFPLLGQNLHRYFFYAAVIISVINT